VQYWNPEKAEGFYHEFQGWLVFVLSLILLFALHRLITLIWGKSPSGNGDFAGRTLERVDAGRQLAALMSTPSFVAAALLMILTASYLSARPPEIHPPRQLLSSLPMEIGDRKAVSGTLDQATLDILGYPEYILRDYVDQSGRQPWVNLFIAYYATQKAGETPHTPAHCIPGAGWILTQRQLIALKPPDGPRFPANRYVIVNGADRELVIYWFQAQGREVASEYRLKYYLVANSIRFHRSDGALIRLMTPMYEGESADAAQARVMQLGDPLLSQLSNYIPR
jgi:EpsI family protein